MSSTTTSSKTTKTLSVVRRETFFDDSFFADSWNDFDSAMKSILQKFDSDSTPKIDFGDRSLCTDVYRKIRTTNIGTDLYQSQALQVTEVDGRFQCVMDVKDFNPNDLQVKIVDDRVVVEGKFEQKSEDGSSMTSKSFYKEFTLPNAANIEQVSTALSKDGVLTIRAPKREGADAVSPSGALSSSQSSQSSSVQQSSSKTVDGGSESSVVQQSSRKESSTFSSTSSFSSSKKVSMSSATSSSFDLGSSNLSSLTDDMSKNMQDRLVFTHDNVNVKLPSGNK